MSRPHEDEADRSPLHKLCDKHLTKELADVVKAQTHLVLSYTDNRETKSYKKFCWDLYHTSPEAYKLLQNAMGLPDPDRLSKDVKVTTEINDKVISALKRKVEVMKDVEKNCSVIVGGMTLEPNMFFSIKEDLIIGFEDINGKRTKAIADHALVIMIRGIYDNWEQIIGYALVSGYSNAVDKWIDEVLKKLIEIGYKVRALITDMEPELIEVSKNRSVTIERPYFQINNKRIYYIFDAPSLMGMLRDDFMKHNVHFNDKVAKYKDVQLYDNDKDKEFKTAAKLNKKHVEREESEKRRVDLAAQLFSQATAAGVGSHVDSGSDTAEFIKTISDVFDMLNSTNAKDEDKTPFCGDKTQFNEMLQFFQQLRMVDKDTGNEATDVRFIQGFSTTIASILLLFEDLKTEQTHLLTGQLNKYPLERFFEQIREVTGSVEPTCRKFISAYRKLFIAYLMKDAKTSSKDLEKIIMDDSKTALDDSKDTDDSFNELFESDDEEEEEEAEEDVEDDDDSDNWEDI